ncbi:uncharacterized protein BT62DRAFT_991550 [Guyanagaster necrorhizus]|uniref:LYR motif-containing protein Cup1-like N-terminal domain-containing protein n=1 Tax=Guyanagaster necrorhizus TaxID=856835 RepID=A0A9P7W183_9AGAR|nr:uncharacterized protein BT62DRAFT_991550 [Guyanagaster necrorhizus MCA 3950]KAG7450699.1 hypothetical protein BT62DRAFT_991550 [Guyanagaster necrorhizus MCA 3950]
MTLPESSRQLFSIYREFIRETRYLPHAYLRHFYRIKASDDVRAIVETKDTKGLGRRKLKRFTKELATVKAAIQGNATAFTHVLDVAYGRKGKLRWELIQPLLTDPKAKKPPPIIPAVEKSRPPVYPKELAALLISPASRSNKKVLTLEDLKTPPTLPSRADPTSEDAKLLGPLSKRREVNIRWRFFTQESRKVYPPLEVKAKVFSDTPANASPVTIREAGIRGFGFQGQGLLEDIHSIVGQGKEGLRPITRRERQAMERNGQTPSTPAPRHPSRWLRRRYQQLLGKLPQVTYIYQSDAKSGPKDGKYMVSLSDQSIAASVVPVHQYSELDSTALAWYDKAALEDSQKPDTGKKRKK